MAVVETRWSDGIGAAWLLLLVVHPEARRRGHGRELIEHVARDCTAAGITDLHLGNAAPRYVWPGIPLDLTPAVACFQSAGFEPTGHGLNMQLPTTYRADPPPGVVIEREQGEGAVTFARQAFPYWEDEVARGVAGGGTFAARDEASGETIGFACHSVNRHGWIGPMATDPDRRARGIGNALLGALSADIAVEHGLDQGEISWAAPVPFYAKAGATVHRTFRMARRRLDPSPNG